jgi:4'-phosphopantetheinyl transferase
MIGVYAVKLPERIEEGLFNTLMLRLPKDKQATIRRFVKPQDALRTLTGEMLTRFVIRERTQLSDDEMVFTVDRYDKPYVKNVEDLHFNVSHSGEWVVCAVDSEPIGIDVEVIKNIKLNIAKRFFSQEEYNDIVGKDENERTGYYYDLWTLKESYIKAVGRGLTLPLNTFTIRIGSSGITIQGPSVEGEFHFKQYRIDKLYKLSVCAVSADFPDSVALKNFYEIVTPG